MLGIRTTRFFSLQFSSFLSLTRLSRPLPIWYLYLPCTWSMALTDLNRDSIRNENVSVSDLVLESNLLGVESWKKEDVHAVFDVSNLLERLSEIDGSTLYLPGLFLVGAVVMRSAGCVVNDMVDRKIDRQVARTRQRPLASGEVSMKEATVVLAGLLSGGLTVLLQLKIEAVLLGCCVVPMVLVYPFMKRLTGWPQLWLGMTYNWGTLLGFVAVTGTSHVALAPLYFASVCWTVYYDTIYAVQDEFDDAKIGVLSTARTFGNYIKEITCLFGALSIAGFGGVGLLADLGPIYYGSIGCAALHMIYQMKIWQPRLPFLAAENDTAQMRLVYEQKKSENASRVFRSNIWFATLITAGFLGDRLIRDQFKSSTCITKL